MEIYNRGSIFKTNDGILGVFAYNESNNEIVLTIGDDYHYFKKNDVEHVGFDENVQTIESAEIGVKYYGFGLNYADRNFLCELGDIEAHDIMQPFKIKTCGNTDLEWPRNISTQPQIQITHDVNGNRINGDTTQIQPIQIKQYEEDEEEIEIELPKMQRAVY